MDSFNVKLYSVKEIKTAFDNYFYGSGADFFFPHPKLDDTPEKECREVVGVRCQEFIEILESSNRKDSA